MINYETDAKPHINAGRSEAEVAVYLSSLCNRNLRVEAVRDTAALLGLVVDDSGDLFAALDAVTDPNLAAFARFFKSYVWDTRDGQKTISLSGSESSVPGVLTFDAVIGFGTLATMLAGQALQADPVDDRFERLRLAMIQAAGGLRFPPPDGSPLGTLGVTPQDVAAAKSAYEIRVPLTAWWAARVAVVREGIFNGEITTRQQAIDAIGGG